MARGQKTRQYNLPPPERMVTRNRGKRQTVVPPALEKKPNVPSRKRTSTKKSWEGSDEELDYGSDLFSHSDEEEVFYDEEYVEEEQFEEEDEAEVAEPFLLDDDDTIPCPWAENEPYEPLVLPNGSRDLFFPSGTLMDLIQIYEIVVNYHRIIQVSPFIFEDFVASMRSPEQTQLVADIHIALLRCLIRDDDEAQISYAVTETSVSYQLIFNLMDATTYGEVLRQYVESDPGFPEEILAIVSKNYPFVPVEHKIKVLLWLCSRFFETTVFSKVIRYDGKLHHNEHCRECGKVGNELIPCAGCDAVYHRHCCSQAVKSPTWLCGICEVHYASETADCLPFGENLRKPAIRRTPIGYDREGRIYWFLVRRIVVEDKKSNGVQFYSTLPAIYDLVSHLDPYRYEANLCKKIYKLLDTIESQCKATQDLSRKRLAGSSDANQNKECYLDLENCFRMSYITWTVVNSKNSFPKFDEKTEAPIEEIPLRLKSKFLKLLGFEGNELVDFYWTGGRGMEELLMYREKFVLELNLDGKTSFIPMNDIFREDVRDSFRLGLNDQGYRSYENLYEKNEYAKSPIQRGKERERKKYMGTRFSIDEPFQWKVSKGRSILDVEHLVLKFLKITLRHVVEKIPDELFHRDWRIKKGQILEHLTLTGRHMEAPEIAWIMLQIEAILRKPTFTNAWWSSLGHIRLYRYSSTEKDARIAFEKQRAQDERDLIAADPNDPNIVHVQATKVKSIPKVLSRMKGEAYRVVGFGDYGGWEWVSALHRLEKKEQEKPPLGISYSTSPSELTSESAKKAHRLEKIVKKLTCWRESQVEEVNELKEAKMKCFSPSCGKTRSTVNGKTTKCYSLFCPANVKKEVAEVPLDTTAIVKAFDPVRRRMFSYEQQNKTFENTEGLGRSFPFPKPFKYLHKKSGKNTILVLPKNSARKLARTGGLTQVPIPGFNANAKTNTLVWNYPCARPLFDNCWRFNTVHAATIHALALQLRIFYCGIRWADLEPNWHEDNDFRFLTTHPDYNELRTVISHREFPPDGYYERYKLKVELFAEDDDGLPPEIAGDVVIKNSVVSVSESLPRTVKPTRKSDRKRSKKGNNIQLRTDTQRKTVERWIDGVELKLFEIVHYWKCYNEKSMPSKQTPQTQKQTIIARNINVSKPMILPVRKRPSPDFYEDQIPMKTMVIRRPMERQVEYGYSYAEVQRPRVVLPQSASYGYSGYQPRIVHINRPSNLYTNNGKRIVYVLRTPDGRSVSQVQSPQYSPMVANGVRIQKIVSDSPPVLTPMVHRPAYMRRLIEVPPGTQQRTYIVQPVSGQRVPSRLTENVLRPRFQVLQSGQGLRRTAPEVIDVDEEQSEIPTAFQSRQLSEGTIHRIIRRPVVRIPGRGGGFVNVISRVPVQGSPGIMRRQIPVDRNVRYFSGTPPFRRAENIMKPSEMGLGDDIDPDFQRIEANLMKAEHKCRKELESQRFSGISNVQSRLTGGVPQEVRLLTQKLLNAKSNLEVEQDDDIDSKEVKNLLNEIVTSVCNKDLEEGWHRDILRQIRSSVVPVMHSGRVTGPQIKRSNHRALETLMAERCETLKKHVLKRRAVFELSVEYDNQFIKKTRSGAIVCVPYGQTFARIEVPEEDEDEDWRMFGWLLDAAEANDLNSCITCKVERKTSCPPILSPVSPMSPLSPLSPLEIDVSDDSDWRNNSASPVSPKKSDLLVFRKPSTRPWWKNMRSESESESRKRSASSGLDSDTEIDSEDEISEERRITRSMAHYLEIKRSRKTGASWPQEPAVAEVPPSETTAQEPENSASCENLELTVKLEPTSEFSPNTQETKKTPSELSGSPTRSSGRQTARLKRLSPGVEESPAKGLIQSICHNGVSIIPPIDMKDIRKSKPGRPSNKDRRKMERQIAIQRKKLTKPGAAKTTVSIDFDVNACHCICRQPYDPKKFYLACNGCKRWFHGKCVNLTEKKAKKLQEWSCEECNPGSFQNLKKKKDQKYPEEESIDGVFCLCHKPYDPSKDYIGCDSCKDWFHFECVKVTHEQTRQINQYVCPICREPEAILAAAKAMQEHQYGELFSRDGPNGEEFRSMFPDLECIEDIVEKAQQEKYSLHEFRNEVAALYKRVSEATNKNHILHKAMKEITTTASDVMLNTLPDHPELP